ncbi:MAG: peroxiredoxin [Phenylobacterium sp.]|uniref:peroxiredoxin n=2 Tax=Phenylobacterium sp. TaxID=1871053 RepID=UPI0025F77BAD|nr:peroxiredoxin [Phenylobacterium sp.]MCA6226683.1 peroxiredoxin [Phenylobacterium sp.]MCA6232220.1 peroxiredoxin [Phenylobacterium sp.]MCA6233925.1 peroxiredoxin [Phenylobacterium sp.]MCA6250598.1 peroxiredoxin [Phenylobacterium sp.]MCA6252975.1 peroxiredoxin [Phenylobacterium sp.]
MAELDAGAKAPDFEMAGEKGAIRLADFAGKPLVLYFYPKDDTSGCTKEAQEFSALAPDFTAAGVAVLGVSKDTVASHGKFTAKYGLAIPLGSDPEGATIEAYGSWVEKSMYGRKYMGIDRSTFLIDGAGVIRKVWRKVKVQGHAAEVLKAALAL